MMEKCSNSSYKLSFLSSHFSCVGSCTFRTITLNQQTLRTIYDILPLKNSTLLTADTLLWCTKKVSIEKIIIPCSYHAPFPHLISCILTKSNLYVANSLATAVSEPDVYRLLTIHVLKVMSLFHCLGRNKISFHVRDTCSSFITKPVFEMRNCQHLA